MSHGDTDARRDERIELWWEDVSGWEGLMVDSETEARLFQAFRQVLQAMPGEMFRQFLALDPVVMCPDESAFVIDCPSPRFREHSRPLIYFAPTIARMTDHNLVDRVAHEMAHVILGHYRQDLRLRRSPRTCEAEADQLSQQWGFRPRYTRAMLRRLHDDWPGEPPVKEPPTL